MRRSTAGRAVALAILAGLVGLVGLVSVPATAAPSSATWAAVPVATPTATTPDRPLAGRVIVVDPGHQLGNSNPRFARQMAQTFFNGTTRKGCNTTGTATNAGLPEATFTWRVARELVPMLRSAGATVHLTRSSNSRDAWGPCVWERARLANRLGADAMISIHADGAPARNHGFFAIAPSLVPGWTEDVVRPDRRLARAMIAGMAGAGAPRSNYIGGQLLVSSNTTSLNVSNVPTVTIELGNMRNASEARRMSSAAGQRQYARWLFAGIQRYFAAR